jgi:hypothetical protein
MGEILSRRCVVAVLDDKRYLLYEQATSFVDHLDRRICDIGIYVQDNMEWKFERTSVRSFDAIVKKFVKQGAKIEELPASFREKFEMWKRFGV